jgi:hypothetical protein
MIFYIQYRSRNQHVLFKKSDVILNGPNLPLDTLTCFPFPSVRRFNLPHRKLTSVEFMFFKLYKKTTLKMIFCSLFRSYYLTNLKRESSVIFPLSPETNNKLNQSPKNTNGNTYFKLNQIVDGNAF